MENETQEVSVVLEENKAEENKPCETSIINDFSKEEKEYELLKVIESTFTDEILEDPRLIGDYIPNFAFDLIAPDPCKYKSNCLYIARVDNHLEIGFANIDVYR